MSEQKLRPWVRAEQELYSFETEALISEGGKEEYRRIIKQLAQAKEIANLALEQVFLAEQERSQFFKMQEGNHGSRT